jgi:hypothetical protein
MTFDNFDKMARIKDELGKNYLKKLGLDSDLEDTAPAYEVADEVVRAFEFAYPGKYAKMEEEIKKEYEASLDPTMSREETIEDLMSKVSDDDMADIYMDDYKYGRSPRSREFRCCQEVILNTLFEKKFKSLGEMIGALRSAPGSYIGPYNYKRLLNHITFAVKSRIIQYYLTRRRIAQSGKRFYYVDPSRFQRGR